MRIERNIAERLHTIESAAELLGSVSPSTIRSWLTDGKLTRVKVGRLTRVRESELLGLVKVDKAADRFPHSLGDRRARNSAFCEQQTATVRKGERAMYSVFGLIDPSDHRVFYVGCTRDAEPQLSGLPEAAANRVNALAPASPQIVILQTVDSRPEVCCVKWSLRFRRDILTSDWKRQEGITSAFTNPKRARRILGEEVSSDAETQSKFHAFDGKNPELFAEMLQRARSFRDEGRETCGVDLIVCEIRYSTMHTNRVDGFKIPNAFQPFYARKLQMVDPSLCGLFVMHHSVADGLVLEDGRTWRDFARQHSDSIRFEEGKKEEEKQ
jgi:excisionase family DNA binding protein